MWRISIAFLIFLIAGPAFSNPPSPTPAKASQEQKTHSQQAAQNTEPPNHEAKNPPLSVTLDGPITIKKSEQDRNDERKESEEKSTQEGWLNVWTCILALVTLVLAVITGFLARYTYKLWKDASDASKQQAIDMQKSLQIAKESADAATATVATMKWNARTELRAYVGVESPQIHHGRDGDPPIGRVTIRNFGKTMATDTEIWINGVMATGDITEFPLGARKLKTVVMPNETLGGLTHNFVRPKDGFTHLYLWGQIKYKDVFEEPHDTIFCFVNADEAYFPTYGGPTIGWTVKNYCEDRNTAT